MTVSLPIGEIILATDWVRVTYGRFAADHVVIDRTIQTLGCWQSSDHHYFFRLTNGRGFMISPATDGGFNLYYRTVTPFGFEHRLKGVVETPLQGFVLVAGLLEEFNKTK